MLKFDLAEQFDMTQPGTYSLRIRFTEAGKEAATQAPDDDSDYWPGLFVVLPAAESKAAHP